MATWKKVLTEGNQVTKGSMSWYYYSANLSILNGEYAERWNDDYGVASSINSQISSTNDTSSSHWQVSRASQIVPYDGTITRFQINIEATGSNGDVDIQLWKATALTKGINYTSTEPMTIDHLCTITYDYDGNHNPSGVVGSSKNYWGDTTSFNNTSLTAGDYLFVVLKRTNGTDGSNYHVHSTMCYDITH